MITNQNKCSDNIHKVNKSKIHALISSTDEWYHFDMKLKNKTKIDNCDYNVNLRL